MSNTIKIQIFLIGVMFALLTAFLQVSPIVSSQYVQHKLSINAALTLDLTSLFFLSYAVLQLPNGFIFDSLGIKYVLPLSTAIAGIGCILYWQANSDWMLGVSRFVIGVGCSSAYIGAVFVAANYFNSRFLPLLISLVEVSTSAGSFLANNLYLSVLDLLGWNMANLIVISALIFLSGYSLGLLKLTSRSTVLLKKQEHISMRNIRSQLRKIFANLTLVFVFLYAFFTWQVIMTFAGFWAKKYYEVMHHDNAVQSLSIVEVYWVSFLISALCIGLFVRHLKTVKKGIVLLALIGFISYLVMAAPILYGEMTLLIITIFCGISTSGVVLSFAIIPYIIDKSETGVAISLNNTFIVLGGMSGQMLFGKIVTSLDFDRIYPLSHTINGYYYSGILMLLLSSMGALLCILYALYNMRKTNITTQVNI